MSKPELVRGLGPGDTTALVVGAIIGTGVFLKTAPMAQAVGSPQLVLLAWLVAGLMSFAGALTYAELGALMPKAGGEYAFLRTAYGDLPAFLFGWMRVVVGATGAIAAFGVAFAGFLTPFIPLDTVWASKTFTFLGQKIDWQFGTKQCVAVGLILSVSGLNCLRVILTGRIQSIVTLSKLVAFGGICIGVFFFGKNVSWEHLARPEGSAAWSGVGAFSVALLAALWAFDGWNNMPMMAGEVRDPGKNIPRALFFGVAIVLLVYGATNLAYFYAMPFDEILASRSKIHPDALPVAANAARSFLGANGPKLISIAFLLSTLGVLNASIMTNARTPFAMARSGLFFAPFARLSGKGVPVTAMIGQAIWASVLALSGTFDQLTDCVVFAGWLFYAFTASAVFVLRRKLPDAHRPYLTPGYPWLPVCFIAVAITLLVNTLISAKFESTVGLGLICLGVPFYFLFKGHQNEGDAEPPSGI